MIHHLGTVRDLAKQDGTIAVHYKYDSFGNVTSGDTSKTRYLFTSREFDTATKLQYNRARYYDAAVGRWISEDPLGFAAGDANVGRYVGNISTQFVDPTGLSWWENIKEFFWNWGSSVTVPPTAGHIDALPDLAKIKIIKKMEERERRIQLQFGNDSPEHIFAIKETEAVKAGKLGDLMRDNRPPPPPFQPAYGPAPIRDEHHHQLPDGR